MRSRAEAASQSRRSIAQVAASSRQAARRILRDREADDHDVMVIVTSLRAEAGGLGDGQPDYEPPEPS